MNQVDSWQGATILADAEDELVGKTLNDTYVVERLLGEGGMGRVYLARHTRIAQKRVAVKVLHRVYLRNAEVLARFQREAETAASICHPNVVAVYDVDRTLRGLPYLVSEYLEGLDLGQHLKQQKILGLTTALHISRQLCEGLGAAHQCGVIHRDLKPSNIFLVGDFPDGVPELPFIKILDFGLSKFVDSPYGQLVTEAGVIMGTPSFMPPEQAQAKPADHRADIYGVGALLYTFLTGRLPFDELTPQATVLAVIGSEPPRPRALVPSIPEHVEQVILRAMAKQPAERYQDMQAMLDALGPLDSVKPPRPFARVSSDTQSQQAIAARPHLVLVLCLALTLLLGSAAVAVAGIEQAAGWALSRLELGLLLTCGAAIAVTPTVLLARWIRRRVWDDTKQVVELSSGVRTAVITAVATYGFCWLASRVFDGVVLRLMGKPMQVELSWPGWDFLLPLIGVGAGIVALLRERALSEMLTGWRRALVVTLALFVTLSLAAFVIPLGLRWQARQVGAPRANASASTNPYQSASPWAKPRSESLAPHAISTVLRELAQPAKEAPAAGAVSASPNEAAESAATATVEIPSALAPSASTLPSAQPARLASEPELSEATARGVEGWVSLADRYPSDPRVLKALVLAHASRAGELGDAMVAASRLFQVAPEEAKNADLQYLVIRAAETPGAPAELAWKMLAEQMGTVGPDVLYGMTLTKPKLAAHAEQLLRDSAVRQRISPALAIARELRQAPSCAARLPLLERAVEVGDERASAALGALSTGTASGCGKNKRRPCWPACQAQAEQFRTAIAKLSQRLKAR